MIKNKIIGFEELYESFAMDWEQRAEELRVRRWRRLKQKLI